MSTTRKTVLLQAMPTVPADPTIRLLGQLKVERFTGSTSVTITLENKVIVGLEQIFKTPAGGPTTLLDPLLATPDYTIQGSTITLGASPLTTDVFVVRYYFRVS